jgi:hypothetical protein
MSGGIGGVGTETKKGRLQVVITAYPTDVRVIHFMEVNPSSPVIEFPSLLLMSPLGSIGLT